MQCEWLRNVSARAYLYHWKTQRREHGAREEDDVVHENVGNVGGATDLGEEDVPYYSQRYYSLRLEEAFANVVRWGTCYSVDGGNVDVVDLHADVVVVVDEHGGVVSCYEHAFLVLPSVRDTAAVVYSNRMVSWMIRVFLLDWITTSHYYCYYCWYSTPVVPVSAKVCGNERKLWLPWWVFDISMGFVGVSVEKQVVYDGSTT